jgi:hypothetical protein
VTGNRENIENKIDESRNVLRVASRKRIYKDVGLK